jgi:hypothetical protein
VDLLTIPSLMKAVRMLNLHPNISLPYHMHGCNFSIEESKDCSLQQHTQCITAATPAPVASSSLKSPSPQQSNKHISNVVPSLASNGNTETMAYIPQDANKATKGNMPPEQQIIQKRT